MNVDLVKQHALELAAAYAYLLHKTEKRVHDPNDHNLCSAVVVPESGRTKTLLSYSNPSALSAALKSEMGLCSGEVIDKFINRGGMQDYHTEVRLINTIKNRYPDRSRHGFICVYLFSTRTVCRTCRKAIMTAQSKISHAAFMAFDFKVDRDGNLGNYVYPIRQDPNAPQEPIDYTV